jgi:hypothetical protein
MAELFWQGPWKHLQCKIRVKAGREMVKPDQVKWEKPEERCTLFRL